MPPNTQLSEREKDRYVSSPSDIITLNKIQIEGNIDIINALDKSTSYNVPELLVGLEGEKSCPVLKETWESAEFHYNNAIEQNIKEFKPTDDIPKELHIALIAYVLELGFYQRLNKHLRELKTVAEVDQYPYKNYYKLLVLAITKVKGVPYEVPKDFTVYRGMEGRVKLGNIVYFQQFLSTSRSKKMAKRFAGDKGTVFVIQELVSSGNCNAEMLKLNWPNCICLDHVHKLIGMLPEEECLIWPFKGFQVIGTKKGADGHKYVYLKS